MSDFVEIKNNSNQLTGYSYQVTEGNVTSTTYFDTNFEITGEAFSDSASSVSSSYNKVVANDNSYVESGSYSKPGEESRAFEFNFDSSGNFTGGTETENDSPAPRVTLKVLSPLLHEAEALFPDVP